MPETDDKSPTHRTTRPLGNSDPQPDPRARGINANAAAKLWQFNSDATKNVRDVIDRKQQQRGGHARG
jgi:hypothetical protein